MNLRRCVYFLGKTLENTTQGRRFYCADCDAFTGGEIALLRSKWDDARAHLRDYPDHKVQDIFIDKHWSEDKESTWLLVGEHEWSKMK
jgi:hypothetical protein